MRADTNLTTHQAAPETETYRGMQVLAWVTLLVSLAAFIALVVLLPLGVGSVLGLVQEARGSRAVVLEGTVLYQPPAAATWRQLAPTADLAEGTRLRTDDRSRVLVSLPDGSTILLFNETELALQRMQFGRFNQQSQDSAVRLFTGQVRLGVSRHPHAPEREITVLVDNARLDLAEGSYLVERPVEGPNQVAVRVGQAVVSLGSRSVRITSRSRAEFGVPSGLVGPLPIERDLIEDSLFATEIGNRPWQSFVDTEAGPQGRVEATDGTLRFVRLSDGSPIDRHGESGVMQVLDIDTRDLMALRLRLEARTDTQSLSGGGTAGTEYPLMVRLVYVDDRGGEQIWGAGFYHQNDAGLSVKLGRLIPRGQWTTLEVDDLLGALQPPAVKLRRIELLGSGWEYDASIRSIEITGH